MQLPVFPAGTTLITTELAFACQDGKGVYVYVYLPVFQQAIGDVAAFRLFTLNPAVGNAGTAREAQFHCAAQLLRASPNG